MDSKLVENDIMMHQSVNLAVWTTTAIQIAISTFSVMHLLKIDFSINSSLLKYKTTVTLKVYGSTEEFTATRCCKRTQLLL